MLANFQKRGVFKGKKVAIFYGADSDKPEVTAVQADLKKLHIPLALTAEDSAVATDAVASDQETASIAERFKSRRRGRRHRRRRFGIDHLGARPSWTTRAPTSLSTFPPASRPSCPMSSRPRAAIPYLDNVLTATPTPFTYVQWQDPGIQKCVAIVKKAYPSDEIDAPLNPTNPDRGVGAGHRRIGDSGLPVPHPLPEDRRRGREEVDGGQLHQGGLRLEERVDPRSWWRLVSFGKQPALRHRSHHRGDLQPDVEDPGACFSHGEVTRARFAPPNYVDGGDVVGWIPARRWGLD